MATLDPKVISALKHFIAQAENPKKPKVKKETNKQEIARMVAYRNFPYPD